LWESGDNVGRKVVRVCINFYDALLNNMSPPLFAAKLRPRV